MSDHHGRFIWFELMTPEPDAASAFYGAVLGWTVADSGMAGMDYRLASVASVPVAGLMEMTREMCAEAEPGWMGYVGVDDVDATVAEVTRIGGAVLRPAEDIPDIGRFAVIADPDGAALVVMTPVGNAGDAPRLPPDVVGQGCWSDLSATDWPRAFAFYSHLFGWRKGPTYSMGDMGDYQLFNLEEGRDFGGMANRPPETPRPFWSYYFSVGSVDEAIARTRDNGGTVVHGPTPVPGGIIAQLLDPQGALFGVVGAA